MVTNRFMRLINPPPEGFRCGSDVLGAPEDNNGAQTKDERLIGWWRRMRPFVKLPEVAVFPASLTVLMEEEPDVRFDVGCLTLAAGRGGAVLPLFPAVLPVPLPVPLPVSWLRVPPLLH